MQNQRVYMNPYDSYACLEQTQPDVIDQNGDFCVTLHGHKRAEVIVENESPHNSS